MTPIASHPQQSVHPSRRGPLSRFPWPWLLVFAIGALQTSAHRNDMSPDGISYLEMARDAAAGNFHALLNAYWSPLYPFLLSLLFKVTNPSAHSEFTFVHALNFLIFLFSFASFQFLVAEISRNQPRDAPSAPAPASYPILELAAPILFLWSTQFWLPISTVTPDMCVAALVYFATALLLRIFRRRATLLTFALLGAALGLAYLAKAAMFPLAFIFLACAFFLSRRVLSFRRAIAHLLLASSIFLLIAAPLIAALSRDKSRLTFGDSGRIAYAEYVNRATLSTHWQGFPPGTGTPLHPTRQVLPEPAMFEFAQPIPGSYPPWRDPSYWYDGIRPHFSLAGQARVLFRAANAYLKMFSKSGALYFVALALIFAATRRENTFHSANTHTWLPYLPSVAALAMYSLVLVEFRYVAPFALILIIWTISLLTIPSSASSSRTALAIILAPCLAIAFVASLDLRAVARNQPSPEFQVAAALPTLSYASGTQFAYVGTGLDAYWAHLAGVRIVAEIPGSDQTLLATADRERQRAILQRFSAFGASAVVTKNRDVVRSMPGWQPIASTEYYLWPLPKPSPPIPAQ